MFHGLLEGRDTPTVKGLTRHTSHGFPANGISAVRVPFGSY